MSVPHLRATGFRDSSVRARWLLDGLPALPGVDAQRAPAGLRRTQRVPGPSRAEKVRGREFQAVPNLPFSRFIRMSPGIHPWVRTTFRPCYGRFRNNRISIIVRTRISDKSRKLSAAANPVLSLNWNIAL